MMEPNDIISSLSQLGGLGIFAYFVWRSVNDSLKNMVEALKKIGESLEKHSVSIATVGERLNNIDRMLDSQRTGKVEARNGL